MIAATRPLQRPPDAKLLAIESDGSLRHLARAELPGLLDPGDLLVANDAATIPASLHGVHAPSGAAIEVRLAGRGFITTEDRRFVAVLFGEGDYRTPTEHRPAPPAVRPHDRLRLGPLGARVLDVLDHPRLVQLEFDGTPDRMWAGIAGHGRPIQYAHLPEPLALWDAWTRIAARPVAFEAPSAGFLLDWSMLRGLRQRGVRFATLTHAAGISSTGDPELDRRFPLDEPYHIPESAARAILQTRERGGRVVAVGTSTTRALESAAAAASPIRAGDGLARLRIGPETRLRVVDAIVTGVHEPGTSHYELLGAFAAEEVLARAGVALEAQGYRSHEYGDSVFLPSRACAGSARRAA
jgi:S-adenosylmethionine:tRNA ribosyltransferase-isomerase